MKSLAAYASRTLDRVLTPLAPAAGWTARVAMRFGVGLVGAACVVVGFAQLAEPLGWLAAGALLLLLDRKVP